MSGALPNTRLKTHRSTIRPLTAVPIGLFGAIAAILIVESGIRTRFPQDRVGLNCQFVAEAVASDGILQESKILLLGDSQVKVGLLPSVFEERLERPTFNLGVLAGPPPLSYFLLQRAIERGARPEAIVVGHMTLAGGSNYDQAPHYAEIATLREVVELIQNAWDSTEVGCQVIHRLCPSIRYRLHLRSFWTDECLVSRSLLPQLLKAQSILGRWDAEDGADPSPPNPTYVGGIDPRLRQNLYEQPWRVSALNALYFKQMIRLAEKYRIKVVWLIGPIVPRAQAIRAAGSLDQAHRDNLRALQRDYQQLTILDSQPLGLASDYFIDSCHLNAAGARRLSEAVADAMIPILGRAELDPATWIELRTKERSIVRDVQRSTTDSRD